MKKKLRILYLINNFSKGGAERFLVDLCTELKNYDDVEYIIGTLDCTNQYQDLTSGFIIKNLNYIPFSIFGEKKNADYDDLINEFKPHIIHTNLFLAEFLSSYNVKDHIAYVCHGHDNMHQFENFNVKTLFNKTRIIEYYEKSYLIRKKYNKCKAYFIANSTHTKYFYEKALPKRMKKNVKLIQYGFNFDKFYNAKKKILENQETLKILNVGSFQDKKNQIFIIDIAKELKKRNIRFEINLLGDGKNFSKVKKAISDNNLESFIFMRGIIDNVEDWYKSSHIYLHTAWYEPFGLVLLEAMASGLPVITLNGKGNIDIIKNGKNGYIFDEQNPVKFADTIFSLYEDKQLYSNISEYAKAFARKFNAKDKFKELIDFYYEII